MLPRTSFHPQSNPKAAFPPCGMDTGALCPTELHVPSSPAPVPVPLLLKLSFHLLPTHTGKEKRKRIRVSEEKSGMEKHAPMVPLLCLSWLRDPLCLVLSFFKSFTLRRGTSLKALPDPHLPHWKQLLSLCPSYLLFPPLPHIFPSLHLDPTQHLI